MSSRRKIGSARRKGWSRETPKRPSSMIETEDDSGDYDNVNIIDGVAPLVSFGPSVMYDVPGDTAEDDEGADVDDVNGNYLTFSAEDNLLVGEEAAAEQATSPVRGPSQQSIMLKSAWTKGSPVAGLVPTSYVQTHLQQTGLDNLTL